MSCPSSPPQSNSLPVTLLLRPHEASTPLHLLTVRTAATAPTHDCVQLASEDVYECEIVVQCDSEDEMLLQHNHDLALDVVGVELCHGPNLEYCERLHWWPALSDTQRQALLPWVITKARSKDRELQPRKKDKDEHKHKRKQRERTRHHARKHKSSGSHKRLKQHRVSEEEKEEDGRASEDDEQPAVSDSPSQHGGSPPTPRSSSSPSSSLSSSSSPSPSPTSTSPTMRHPPCCACGHRTTCSRSKFCRCLAAGQRCGHCASDFCENNPRTKPHQRTVIVSRQVVQHYQKEMKRQTGKEEVEKDGWRGRNCTQRLMLSEEADEKRVDVYKSNQATAKQEEQVADDEQT